MMEYMTESLFFYDLETSGLHARTQRIMQFAGQRTDKNMELIGEPVNVLVKLSDDILPEPYAITVTGITPQQTLSDGREDRLREREISRTQDRKSERSRDRKN